VGLATNIPPHNLGDVCKAALLIEARGDDRDPARPLKGPDFPLGGRVVTDRATLRKIYEDGQGSIKVQAEWKEETHSKKQFIIVTSIPYGVDKGELEAAIGAIIEERKLPQLLNVIGELTEKDGLRIALEVKPGTDANLVMAYLYKHTKLQDTFSYNLTCLVPVRAEDGTESTRPERLGLKGILRYFLNFRLATVRRRFEYELEHLRRRIHILEGFRIIFDALDKAIKMIRESEGKATAQKLIKAFKLDEVQANAVLTLPCTRRANGDQEDPR
jgi:DNA gyrase subunit A